MPKFIEKEIECAVCHKKVKVNVLVSCYGGQSALDGNQNNKIQYKAIQVCPKCGHVALDITKPVQKVSSKNFYSEHQELNNILKGADTYALNQNDILASYMYRLASWRSLELNKKEMWKECMLESINYLERYLITLPVLSEEQLPYFIILIDCYRQVASFDQAIELSQECLENLQFFHDQQLIEYIRKVIQFELTLIRHQDTNEHRSY